MPAGIAPRVAEARAFDRAVVRRVGAGPLGAATTANPPEALGRLAGRMRLAGSGAANAPPPDGGAAIVAAVGALPVTGAPPTRPLAARRARRSAWSLFI